MMVLLMICNRPDISSADRWEFVKDFVEDFVAILVAIHFATPFATKNARDNFAIISLKISLLHFKFWRNPNEILAKINVAKSYGKTFAIKNARQKVWRNSDEMKTKETTKKILLPENIASGRKLWWSSITIYTHMVIDGPCK